MYKNILFVLFLLFPLNVLAGSDGGFVLILTKVNIVNNNKTILTFHNPKEEYLGKYEIYKKCSTITLEIEYSKRKYFIDRLKNRNYKEYKKHFEYLNKIQNFINKKVILDIDMGGSPNSDKDISIENCTIQASWLEIHYDQLYPKRYL